MSSGRFGTESPQELGTRHNELDALISLPESFGSKLARWIPNLLWLAFWIPVPVAVHLYYFVVYGPISVRDFNRINASVYRGVQNNMIYYPGLNDMNAALLSGLVLQFVIMHVVPDSVFWVYTFLLYSHILRFWHLLSRWKKEVRSKQEETDGRK